MILGPWDHAQWESASPSPSAPLPACVPSQINKIFKKCGRICLGSLLFVGSFFFVFLFFVFVFNEFTYLCWGLVYSNFLFLPVSVLVGCKFLELNQFLLGFHFVGI